MVQHDDLQQHLQYQFRNPDLLQCALTHRSLGSANYERLEFLGDAVLGLIIAQELYRRYPDAAEGQLSRLRSILVNRNTLANIALQLHLPKFVLLGAGESKSGGHYRESILSDSLEAIIGAIYLDSDVQQTTRCVVQWYDTCYTDLSNVQLIKDPKSRLQELLQSKKQSLPVYEAKVTGEAHAQTFYVTCRVEGCRFTGHGESSSRRKAEQLAAENFLEQYHE